MKVMTLGVLTMLILPSVALAHVTVRPRESRPATDETYTVRVPTEGQVATTSVEIDVPDGVTVSQVMEPAAGTYEVKKDGARVTAIVWKQHIAPRQAAEFVFRARNPAQGAVIAWKAHQYYADGTASHWVNAPGERQPAPVTRLIAAQSAGSAQPAAAAEVEAWLAGYDAAFNAKDLDRLATFYHPEVTIYEGGGIDRGWADYRDRHLGPELRQFQNLQFSHGNTAVRMLGPDAAYATSEYSLKAKMGERDIDAQGLETLVLVREAGAWKIRHSHTSSRSRRPAAPAQ